MELSLHGSQINLTVRDKPPTPPAIEYPAPTIASAAAATSTVSTSSAHSHQHHQHQHHHHLHQHQHRQRRRPESADHLWMPKGGGIVGGSDLTAVGGRNRFGNSVAARPRWSASAGSSLLRQPLSAQSFVNDTAETHRAPQTTLLRPVSADNVGLNTAAGRTAATRAKNCGLDGGLRSTIQRATSSSNILNLLLAEPIPKKTTMLSWNKPTATLMSNPETVTNNNNDEVGDESSVEEDIESMSSNDVGDDHSAKGLSKRRSDLPSSDAVRRPTTTFGSKPSTPNTRKYVTFSKEPEVVVRTNSAAADNPTVGSKPDLPGRVSFSTAEVFELDFSDCDDDGDEPAQIMSTGAHGNVVETLNNNQHGNGSEHVLEEPSCCPISCSLGHNKLHHIPMSQKKIPNAPPHSDESDKIISEYKREIAKLNQDHEQNIDRIGKDSRSFERTPNQKLPSIESDSVDSSKSGLSSTVVERPTLTEIAKSSTVDASATTKITIESGSVVINNYLKETKKPLPTIHTVVHKPAATICPKKTTKANFRRSVSAKSRSDREESRLNEFQLDKVESWMSIHEFADNRPGDAIDAAAVNNPTTAGSSLASPRRRDTPTSKTDDEGMYSYDDQPDDGADSSTYEEIASVLKEIDNARDEDDDAGVPFARNFAKSPPNRGNNDEASECPDKMREILAYLDGVETSCTQTMQDTYGGIIPDSFRSDIEFAVEPDIIGDTPKIADLITLPNQQLARRVIALSLRANELATAIQLSREHMASVRTEKVRTVRAEKQTAAGKLAEQKRQFEGVVQRHQTFIEQLLKDKTDLTDKVTALNRRIDSQNQAWQHKLDTELVRVKETTMAAEKIRRERWVRENTKKIKELTVKGLEHEINQMTSSHQTQLADLRRQQQRDLLQAIEEERHKHEQLENGIRESYATDREAAIEKERNAIRERFERQIANEAQSAELQKTRLLAEFAEEKKRLLDDAHAKALDFERLKAELQLARDEAIGQTKAELSSRMAATEQRHQTELRSLQLQYESDFKIWRRDHETAARMRETERENSIRREAHLERDRQIDEVVAKLDADNVRHQQDFELKLSRLIAKHTDEIAQLEQSENGMREKLTECRAQLADAEAARDIAKATAKQHAIQLEHVQQLYDAQLAMKDTLKESARRDVQSELVALRKDRDAEIERIHARVQQAIERKDATVDVLHKENAALKERCVKLEAIVRQQRQDYCVK